MKVKEANYIFPPRITTVIPRDSMDIYGQLNWKAQYKYNDSRCLIKIKPGQNIELWNRHGERFRDYHTPEHLLNQIKNTANKLHLHPDGWHLLDGGLLDKKHKAIKDTIVIWDILVQNSEHLIGSTYGDRYSMLQNIATEDPWTFTIKEGKMEANYDFGYTIEKDIFIPELFDYTEWPNMWSTLFALNRNWEPSSPLIEGIVIKDLNGELGFGLTEKNNTDWMAKSRVSTRRHDF